MSEVPAALAETDTGKRLSTFLHRHICIVTTLVLTLLFESVYTILYFFPISTLTYLKDDGINHHYEIVIPGQISRQENSIFKFYITYFHFLT